MKSGWVSFIILPIFAFSTQNEKECQKKSDETLAFGLDLFETEEFDNKGLALFETDESDGSLIPWAIDELNQENVSFYVEDQSQEIPAEFEDVFSFEFQPYSSETFEPTVEKLPERRKSFFGKPRVVPSKKKQKRGSSIAEKKKTSKSKSEKELVIKN